MRFEPIRIYFSDLRSSAGGSTGYCASFHRLNYRVYSGCTLAKLTREIIKNKTDVNIEL